MIHLYCLFYYELTTKRLQEQTVRMAQGCLYDLSHKDGCYFNYK